MPADEKPPRARTHGDRARDFGHAHHRSPAAGVPIVSSGIPVEADEEVTPPPQMPPSPDETPGYETLPPPIRAQLAAMHDAVAANTDAVRQMWPARRMPEDLLDVQHRMKAIDAVTKDIAEISGLMREFAMPAIKSLMGVVDRLSQQQTIMQAQTEQFHEREWPRLSQSLDQLGVSIDRMERQNERLEGAVTTLTKRLDDQTGALSKRVERLENELTVRDVKIRTLEDQARDAADLEAVVSGQNTKIRTLEDANLVLQAQGKAIRVSAGMLATLVSIIIGGIGLAIHFTH